MFTQKLFTYIAEIVVDYQILAKWLGKFRIHVQYVEEVVPEYFVQITVGERAYRTGRLADVVVQ